MFSDTSNLQVLMFAVQGAQLWVLIRLLQAVTSKDDERPTHRA